MIITIDKKRDAKSAGCTAPSKKSVGARAGIILSTRMFNFINFF